MKKILAIFLCLMLAASFALAKAGEDSQGGADNTPIVGNDKDEHGCIGSAGYQWCEEKQKCLRTWEEDCPSLAAEDSKGAAAGNGSKPETAPGQQVAAAMQEQNQSKTLAQAMERIKEQQQEMEQEQSGMDEAQKKIYQNQNTVRLAVHTLLDMEGLIGGIGQNVSAIAREFDNSVQSTIQAEEKIQTRSAISRFFAGGDENAADEIEQQVAQNQLRIQELNQLLEQCDCDEETQTLLKEQIQNMEQEQTRLQELAQSEKQSKGILGWLWK